jgi:predicted DsbA family dithiol-disulfide isomerase
MKEQDIELEWRGFQLRPDTPGGGARIADMFPPGYLEPRRAQFRGFAESFGVTDFVEVDHVPNTVRVLALCEHARDQGKLEELRLAAMRAHWREGRDLGSDDVLRALAEEAGLDGDVALAAADSEEMQARVEATRRSANRMGVSGIPTYIFHDGEKGAVVVGCQPYEVLMRAFEAVRDG